jgi:hypothetical protein
MDKINWDRLRIAVNVACGVTKPEHADYDELGWAWYKPSEAEVREKCAETILDAFDALLNKEEKSDDNNKR